MNRFIGVAVVAGIAVALYPPPLLARADRAQTPSPATSRVKACSFLTKEEVKKHLPWNAILDKMPTEEEPVGAAGSSCNYPSVFIQVFPVPKQVTGPPSKTGYEPVSGVGNEAYFRNNRNEYAELYVRTPTHTVTLQADADGKVDAVKPNVINLAKALIAKLR